MKRGDIVLVAAPGDYGKPRPAVIIQSGRFIETHSSILVCLITSSLFDAPLFRIHVEPTPANGLKAASQIMADKIITMKREKVGDTIGRLDNETLLNLNRSLALFIGLAD
jgi:mRNA interferase MazF